ncbi:unnamed protein product [Triticum aestivum]|uniref:Uncharacterized protein n=1 Tax=Triticum aestivum TaxID=4565 RepID=A0A7H4LRG0_WHEAT|nr:unnamed protein product [Triticum aestivum]
MSTSKGSESADSMDEDTSQVPHARRSKFEDPYCRGLPINSGCLQEEVFVDHEKKPSESLFVFDEKVCRELMVKYCVHAEIPFLKFEDPHLQPWIDSMQPAFQIKGCHTIRDDAVKMYKGMKKDIEVELQNLDSRICLTSDMWTSSQDLGYMCITAHYINAEFNYKKKTISFAEVKYPHTGYVIEEEIVRCLTEWGIRGKLFTLTLDNASNNTNACEELIKYHKHELLLEGQHLHVRCCGHILNILVQDGMKIIHEAIDMIRELMKYIDSSPSRLQDFNTIASGMGLRAKKGIFVDTPTRWNSTWKMLVEALTYKSVLTSYANRKMIDSPSEEEWEKAKAICEFLKAFEELTLIVSAHRKPTSHKFLLVVLSIRHALKDPGWQTSDVLKELAAVMQTKLDKYWDPEEKENADPNRRRKSKGIEFNHALVIATFLDPRRKEDYLDFFYCKLSTDGEQITKQVEIALEWVRKYVKEYELLAATSTAHSTPSSQGNTIIGSPVAGKRKLEEEFAQHKSRRRSRVHKSELDAYLEEASEKVGDDFDVLGWWKRHGEKFPILASMARDFLAIPLSTVASESAFSCG